MKRFASSSVLFLLMALSTWLKEAPSRPSSDLPPLGNVEMHTHHSYTSSANNDSLQEALEGLIHPNLEVEELFKPLSFEAQEAWAGGHAAEAGTGAI